MKKIKKNPKGITLVALVITIIILLILAGVAISALGGENGLLSNVKLARKAQIKAEMREQLVLALSDLQLEKNGEATLDDITQEWANNTLEGYDPTITSDASISGKIITMQKSGITGKYIIDENLNIEEVQGNISNIEFTYETFERTDNKVKILIHVRDKENGLSRIEFPDEDAIIIEANKKEEKGIDYEVEIGTEYRIKIISESGEEREETILITDYWHNITKNLGEGISIDNVAVKAAYNKPYQATLTTENDYIIETLIVTMGGQEVTVDKTTGVINIEKVTGDIEITATAKKLEIITTQAYVNTTQNATSSAVTNSVDKSQYKLYVSFTATLEGQNCTIEPALTQAITSNGNYTYTITGTYQGKTITTTKEVTVDQYKSAQNLVAYDAGEWTKEEIEELQALSLYDINIAKVQNDKYKLDDESGTCFTFGGFTYKGDTSNATNINNGTIVTSRNKSVARAVNLNAPIYEGWQILEIKDSSGNVINDLTEINNKLENLQNEKIYVTKLIHAGSPENFAMPTWSNNIGYQAEFLLTGIASYGEQYKKINSGKEINARNWDKYKDKTLNEKGYIRNVHILTLDEATKCSSEILKTGCNYFLATASSRINELIWVSESGTIGYLGGHGGNSGIRPVVEMNDGVYITGGNGTEASPYVLGMEQNGTD